MPFGKQSGEGAALPVAPAETVKGSGRRGGAARSPERARTRPAWTTTPNGRRLPLDRLGRGCVADRKTKRLRTGVSGRKPVDPPERHMNHPGPRRARASPVSSWAAQRRQGRSEGKAAISGLHRQPATARPVDHRLTLDPCGLAYSLLWPRACTPKVVPARGWTTGLTARVSGPARRDEMGRAGRPGPAGEGLARDETGIRAPQPGASP